MYQYLDNIRTPEDVKKLNPRQAEQLADEVRDFLIDSFSGTGGHLSSNLGVVELTVALSRVFSFPEDKIVWDVGHQSYVYKLFTGRKDRFSTLRKFGGLSGFPKTGESEYDSFNTGHSSTSVSAALGLKKAMDAKGDDSSVIAVIGDGALSGGMAIEAFADAGNYKKNFIVILNDNNMSISTSVNGFTMHLSRLRAVPAYLTFKSGLERTLSKNACGRKMVLGLKKIKDMVRHILIGRTAFDDMGFTYIGPIDGHDIETLTLTLERAKKMPCPVLLHVLTKKGKGYKFAEDAPTVYHGVSTFEAEKGISLKHGVLTYSGTVGETLCNLAIENENICVVTAAMATGTGTESFHEQFPDRFYDVGIAEQHAVTFSAGLAAGGRTPFVVIYSSFLQRAYDQILHDVCLQNLNVVFLIDRAGIVGEDGETHHGLYDLSFMSAMPGMTVLAPANFAELREMLTYAASGKHTGPIAIRYPRGVKESAYRAKSPFVLGEADVLETGSDVCILATGLTLSTGEKAAAILKEQSISVSLINLKTLCPLPEETVLSVSGNHKLLVTLEDGVVSGGIGEHIAAYLAGRKSTCPVLIKG
ncbi:MAG: 1-deoxy-D-xylulose-5-phosphate synthase, partial [Clostridia bacterium]|nr:1-deoxy-D-xylulose-5-phosphate synthase [Clostridia bacterium]